MNFKGGVIIIGSLLWEDTPIRHKWKTLNLKSVNTKHFVSVPIRYGRQSSTRRDTYTMIFSNHISTQQEQAYILGFKDDIKNANNLQSQAFALGAAEGFWTKESPSINKSWGTVGLLVNPKSTPRTKRMPTWFVIGGQNFIKHIARPLTTYNIELTKEMCRL